jgi:hypothetical protein
MVMDLSPLLITQNISNTGAKNSGAEIHNQKQTENSITNLTFRFANRLYVEHT